MEIILTISLAVIFVLFLYTLKLINFIYMLNTEFVIAVQAIISQLQNAPIVPTTSDTVDPSIEALLAPLQAAADRFSQSSSSTTDSTQTLAPTGIAAV